MRKIVEYNVVTKSKYNDFIEEVNDKIKEGWQPIGGVVGGYSESYGDFWEQAVVKYEDGHDYDIGYKPDPMQNILDTICPPED